jgi:hypothetical protein
VPGGDDEAGQRWAPFGPSGEDKPAEEFDPPQTATPGPPPGAPPTPPPPTKPQPPAEPAQPAATPTPAYPPQPSSPPPAGYGPPQYGSPPQSPPPYGYAPSPAAGARTNGKAVASLVLGIAGWLVAPFILSVLGIIFGALARKEIAANPSMGGKGLANWGFWLSISGLVAWVVLIIVLIAVGGTTNN